MSDLTLIRAGHTEVSDGQCGLCDTAWPCDTGVVLAALDAEQRARYEVDVSTGPRFMIDLTSGEIEDLRRQLAAAQERIAELEAALESVRRIAVSRYELQDEPGNVDRYWLCVLCANWWGIEDPEKHTSDCPLNRAALAGSQGGGGEFTPAEREAIISGSLTVPRATVERAMAQATTDAETTAPECRDGWHAIRPGEGACVCGENRMELML